MQRLLWINGKGAANCWKRSGENQGARRQGGYLDLEGFGELQRLHRAIKGDHVLGEAVSAALASE
jgi:hypothetical protein